MSNPVTRDPEYAALAAYWAKEFGYESTRTCTACGAVVAAGPGVWVEVVSGDDGGTYDICPERYDAATDTEHGHVVR